MAMSSAASDAKRIDHSPEVYAAQVRLLYEQAPSAMIATAVNAAIMVPVLWGRVSNAGLLGWFLACVLLTLVRFWQRRAYLRQVPATAESSRWARRFLSGVAVNGLLWGSAGFYFFIEQSYIHQLFLAFVLAGMASGSIATLSPVQNAYPIFLVPALLPYVVRLAGTGSDVHLAIGGMLVLYIVMMAIISRRHYATVAESLRLRFDNLDLLHDLIQAKERQERANQELAAQIVEKRHAQDALQEAYARLEQRVRERTEKLARSEAVLRDTNQHKDEFLAMLAHELRNPLVPIHNAADILKRNGLDSARLAWCRDVIDRQVGNLGRLIDDLLDISRINQGKIELKKEPLDVKDFIRQAIETSRPLIDARLQEFLVDLPSASLWVEGDQVRLTQVVSNLLNNAAKYTGEGGRIWLVVEPAADQVCIRVRDTGCGIDPSALSSLFDLFYQVDQTLDRSQGGLGIGLSLVHRLVAMHGGEVRAFSAGRGQGSEFVVRLPQMSFPENPADSATALPGPSGGQLDILVVDDNHDAAESLAMLLEIDSHRVRIAHDGPGALEMARAERPDVVLLDIGLPGMDGYQVARALRQSAELERTLLIALTGYGQPQDLEQSRAAGFDGHLVKPVDIEALQKLLAKCQGPDRHEPP